MNKTIIDLVWVTRGIKTNWAIPWIREKCYLQVFWTKDLCLIIHGEKTSALSGCGKSLKWQWYGVWSWTWL